MSPGVGFALKAAVSLGAVALLLIRLGPDEIVASLRATDPVSLAACTLACTIVYLPFALRWTLVGKAIGLQIPLGLSLRLVTIGAFFNQVLPSSIGGDVVRVWLLRRGGDPLRKIVSSVLIDRIAALAGMLVAALIGLPFLEEGVKVIGAGVVLLVLASTAGIALAACLDRIPLPRIAAENRLVHSIRAIAGDLRLFLAQPRRVLPALGLGMLIHLMVSLGAWTVASGMGIHLGLLPLLVLMPLALLASMLPISVAGWGVREGAMVFALASAGVPASDAFAVSVVFGLAVTLAGLPGGVLWLAGSYGQLPASKP